MFSIVYKINYSTCSKSYNDQTKQYVYKQLNQHFNHHQKQIEEHSGLTKRAVSSV